MRRADILRKQMARERMPTICPPWNEESFKSRLIACRAFLYVHGILDSEDNERARRRINKKCDGAK